MLENGRFPKVFGWKEALGAHLDHEREVYIRGFKYDLKKIESRLHILEGLLIALAKIEDNTFGRQPPLEMIKSVKAKGADYNRIMKIYQTWYKLPNSARDEDAFIVKYARKTHLEIARRLICPSLATIEHIVPISRRNKNSSFLGNMLLVSARFNNERNSMPLDEYIMLNSEVDMCGNMQKYVDLVIKEVGRSDLPGRPILYETTSEFLDYFGLATIEDLPDMRDFLEENESVEEDSESDLYTSKYVEEVLN